MRLPRSLAAAATLTLVALTACDRHFFHAAGVVSSDGGAFGRWSATPQGCSRAPGRQSASPLAASFFWEDPAMLNARLREHWGTLAPDAPLRLDLFRPDPLGSASLAARMQTVKTPGTPLDSSTCSTLDLRTSEQAPAYPGGRPTLRGTLLLDCRVHGSHLTANLQFDHCEF